MSQGGGAYSHVTGILIKWWLLLILNLNSTYKCSSFLACGKLGLKRWFVCFCLEVVSTTTTTDQCG